jgi:hypothetical protein
MAIFHFYFILQVRSRRLRKEGGRKRKVPRYTFLWAYYYITYASHSHRHTHAVKFSLPQAVYVAVFHR